MIPWSRAADRNRSPTHMMEAAPQNFSANHLRLLGRYYQNDLPLALTRGPHTVDVGPPLSTWKPFAIMTALLALGCSYFIWAALATNVSVESWVLLCLIGVLATAGPVAGHLLRLRYLRQRTPLVSFSAERSTISILGGEQVFTLDEVYALLGLTLCDEYGEPKSELQLITRRGDSFVPHLIKTDLSESASRSYGSLLKEFASLTGVRAIIAGHEGLLKSGPVRLAEATSNGEPSNAADSR